MQQEKMLPLRPYILPSVYQWIVESGCTPYLLVDALADEVAVPEAYIQNGEIVLNLSPEAIRDLEMTKTYVSFRATFGGQIEHIYVPMPAVLSIFAAENGRGMPFEDEGETLDFDEPVKKVSSGSSDKPSHLHLLDDE